VRLHSKAGRFIVYSLLPLGSLAFVMPFVWLVSTSLKPIDQVMTLPMTFVPRAYYAELDGRNREVTLDFTVGQAGAVAVIKSGPEAGSRVFLSDLQLATRAPEVRILHRVQPGWWHITAHINQTEVVRPGAADGANAIEGARWDVVPRSAVSSHIRFRWKNYPEALSTIGGDPGTPGSTAALNHVSFWVFLGNSFTVCVLGVIGTVFSNSIVAYGFSRIRWRGRDAFFAVTLATMMVPFPALMVPLYGVFRALHMVGTLQPLWLPTFFGSAFNIFLMRQFFLTIPEELSEAARIDGCSEWRIFIRIILPLSKPVLAVAALFHFLYAWNDFLGPLLYLSRKNTFTLSLALQRYQSQTGGVQWHYLMAASTVTILPIVVLFLFTQRFFVQGIATTGTKG
jgi:multiple sugar transport system permease protein